MSTKTACVVGTGAAGLAALKECIRQGLKTTCYELDEDVGGIWRKKDYSKPTNTPSIWENLITNSSKFNSCYSDLPPLPEETPYLTAEAMFNYFKRVVKHYNLEPHIQFNTRVVKIRKTKDYDETGKWEVYTTKRGSDLAKSDRAGPSSITESDLSRCHKEIFDCVLVCTGHFKIPLYPDVTGIEKFRGTVQHAFEYNSYAPYQGKTVLVVGNKLSAADIASDVANVAKKVYIAVGKGMWIIPRCYANAAPLDLVFSRKDIYSSNAETLINERLITEAERMIDHDSVGIKPDKPPLSSPFGISDDLSVKMLSGRVRTYGHLTRLEGNTAYFKDETSIKGIDSVIFCTGYKPDLSFLDLPVIEESGKMELFKMIFPLNQKHASLALIGNFSDDAPLALAVELQSRLAARVMSGKHKLPSEKVMKADADFWNKMQFARRGNYNSYFLNGVALMESIAQEIGCYPTFWKVFAKNPALAYRTWYGPIFGASYRLIGPDSDWENASKTCNALYNERYSSIKNIHRDQPHKS